MELKLNITESNYKIFKEIADNQSITVEKVIEDYFLLNKELPNFKIAKADKYFITVLLNIISELELLKSEVYESKEKIKSKKDQYELIHRYIDATQLILQTINSKYDECEKNKLKENKEKDLEAYFHIITELHNKVAGNHWRLVKFLKLLVKNFKDVKSIKVE